MKELQLTKGSAFKNLVRFSLPFLLSSFLQTFYGLADLFITGQFNSASTITAVSIGSQIMHMVTVIIVGLTMGITVAVGQAYGAGDTGKMKKVVGTSVSVFFLFAVLLAGAFFFGADGLLGLLATPPEAVLETKQYFAICICGTFFITAYNVAASVFRGLGDSKTPMYFVALSGIINILLDYVLIGPCGMGAKGAAAATVAAQGVCVVLAWLYAVKRLECFRLSVREIRPEKKTALWLLRIGLPVAAQDGFIQVSFLVITAIANMRGVDAAAAVGIVEKLISFMFLVPSAMLASVSAITAQNVGAGQHDRCRRTLGYGIMICVISGIVCTVVCNWKAEALLALFDKDEPLVVQMGAQYLRAYVFDCIAAGIHFCFSGFFCAYEKAYLSFLHNIISILFVRIPGSYYASVRYPDTLLPMGMAAPLGSLLSAVICLAAFLVLFSPKKK